MMVKRLTPIAPPAGVPAQALDFPANLFWPGELNYSPVVQVQARAIDGSQHLFAGAKKSGRPIELRGEDKAWISRADLRVLQAWAAVPGLRLTLWWDAASYLVVFDHGSDGKAVESAAIYAWSDITDAEPHHHLVLRFLTVE